jgi:1,4-dihydroxy-6-naphthoate synthase
MTTAAKTLIRVGHSPDPDDAFMFHALAHNKFDTGRFEFTHELVDIETLNRRALQGELEVSAVSIHGYAYLTDKYALCSCGASMGDQYGPMVIGLKKYTIDELKKLTIAVPGTLTSAYLSLRLCLGNFKHVVVPFDKIFEAVEAGEWEGQKVDAGLIIHEGQLTYGERKLELSVDLGKWWFQETGLPLPLGGNVIRKDLGTEAMHEVNRLLRDSIVYGLQHRKDALDHALQYGRDLNRDQADKFVGMYVNDWTVDWGPRGREAIKLLLQRGFEAGVIPHRVEPEFID